MTKAARTIQEPGAAPVKSTADDPLDTPPGAPGVEFDEADMAAFTADDLEAVPAAELQAALAETLAMNKKLSARLDVLEGRMAGKPAPKVVLPTVAEAVTLALADIKAGKRPRSTLTDQGWYCHPEMARIAVSGVKPAEA